MVEAGYAVAEALAAATSVAAQACGVANDTGRLAPGRVADLLVVEGDLSVDPSFLGGPRQVIIRGRPLHAMPSPPLTTQTMWPSRMAG